MKPRPSMVKRLAALPVLDDPFDEECAFILGKVRDDGSSTVTGFEQTENLSDDPSSTYKVHIPKHDDRIIGVLHTHLKSMSHEPGPSPQDRANLPHWLLGAVLMGKKVVWYTSSAPASRPRRAR